eukprot:Opistho-1_new@37383
MLRSRHVFALLALVVVVASVAEAGSTVKMLKNPKFFIVGKQRYILGCETDGTCSVRNNNDGTWSKVGFSLPVKDPNQDTTFQFDHVTWGLSSIGLYRQNPANEAFDLAGLWQCDACDAS